ncbi:MAG: DUF2306 domain-containing protein [Bacteroidota bacterium]
MKTNKVAWFVFVFLSIALGLYPIVYFFTTRNLGLLYPRSDLISENILWNVGFYGHIFFHGLALLIGWCLFSQGVKNQYLKLVEKLRKIYFLAAVVAGICNVAIGLFSEAGWIASVGFVLLGVAWLYTTYSAYAAYREKDLNLYNGMLIYSFAACFAAVTFRLWLPVLQFLLGDFRVAYTIVAWLCWVPNMFFASYIVKRKGIILG